MAKVSAHGREIGTVEGLKSAKRYMSDGVVLINRGFGWKIHGRVKKDGTTIEEIYQKAIAKQKTFLAERPAYAEFRKQIHNLAGLSKRWKLCAAIELMPDDPDGVWSEACDGYGENIHADVDDIVSVCRAYKGALMEQDDIRKEKMPA